MARDSVLWLSAFALALGACNADPTVVDRSPDAISDHTNPGGPAGDAAPTPVTVSPIATTVPVSIGVPVLPTVCIDVDHDGHGRGCELGLDCDDFDASRTTDCGAPLVHGGVGVPVVRPDLALPPGSDCADGTQRDCYSDPTPGPTALDATCGHGLSFCLSGHWGTCAITSHFTIPRAAITGALITGPTPCNPCDPECYTTSDVPTMPDLTAMDSSGVVYDPVGGGITLPGGGSGGMGTLTDTDGDGVPDVADCAPMDPLHNCTTDVGGIYHTLAFGTSAPPDPLNIMTTVRTADVYFLMDTTGSMGGELFNLQTALTSGTFIAGCPGGIIGAIQCTIPDAWFGVGAHDDYPVNPYGGATAIYGDVVYSHRLDIQSSVAAAQTAVNALAIHWGNDGPESQTQALDAIASGGGLSTYLGARAGCPAGRWGYPCFRPGTIPIVIYITDAPFHNGPASAYPYCIGGVLGGSTLPAPTAIANTNENLDNSAYPGGGAATNITGAWVGFTGNTSGMANNFDFCVSSARDATFRVHLSSAQTTRFTLEGSSYDTVLGVFPLPAPPITGWCNDDYPGISPQSEVDLGLAAGDYYVAVDGWGGGSGAYRLSMGVPPPPSCTGYSGASYANTVSALTAGSVKLIELQSCGVWSDPYCLEGESHGRSLATATGSVDSSGNPEVIRINSDGTGLSTAVVNAVSDLANYARMDITLRVNDDPTTPAVDERNFVAAIATVATGGLGPPPTGSVGRCTATLATWFQGCLPGTSVQFRVTLSNTFVMPTAVPQVFHFTIDELGSGSYVLGTTPVTIVVPASAPMFPVSGTFHQDYDSTTRCSGTEVPRWGTLSWTATYPAGTMITWQAQTANTAAGLATAPIVSWNAPTVPSPVNVGDALVAGGQSPTLPYLRLTSVLLSSPDRARAPTLSAFDMNYACIPGM